MSKKNFEKKIIDLANKDSNFRDQLKKVAKVEKLTDRELERIAGGLSDIMASVNLNMRDAAR